MTRNILVEVEDDYDAGESSLAENVATDSIDGDYDYVEIVEVYDNVPHTSFDEIIRIDEYTAGEEYE